MLRNPFRLCTQIPSNRLQTSAFIALFSAATTIFSKFYFTDIWYISLAIGMGICTLTLVWLLHYFIFSKLKSRKLQYLLLLVFPVVYAGFLITMFATYTTLMNFTWYQVPFINQVYLQMWGFLGDAYIFAIFAPKIPFILTSLLVIISFYLALNQSHTQPEHD